LVHPPQFHHAHWLTTEFVLVLKITQFICQIEIERILDNSEKGCVSIQPHRVVKIKIVILMIGMQHQKTTLHLVVSFFLRLSDYMFVQISNVMNGWSALVSSPDQSPCGLLPSFGIYSTAKSVTFQGLSQRGINEKSMYTWTVRETTWTRRTERDVFTRPSRIVIIDMFIHNEYYMWLYLQSFILCHHNSS
jgi:hypothetical protein